jgi:DNA polymerase V
MAAYVTRAGEKLRRARRHARQMMVFLHNSPFDAKEAYFSRQAQACFQLPYPTSDSAELIHQACHALARIFRPGIHYSKCGVMLTELTPDTQYQGDFLDTRDTARSKQLMDTVDAINRRMGRDTLFYAATGIRRDWAMSATMKSQHFTTNWQQMMCVKV